MELTLPGDKKVPCTPSKDTWEFTCKLPTIPDQRYLRIPITISLGAALLIIDSFRQRRAGDPTPRVPSGRGN